MYRRHIRGTFHAPHRPISYKDQRSHGQRKKGKGKRNGKGGEGKGEWRKWKNEKEEEEIPDSSSNAVWLLSAWMVHRRYLPCWLYLSISACACLHESTFGLLPLPLDPNLSVSLSVFRFFRPPCCICWSHLSAFAVFWFDLLWSWSDLWIFACRSRRVNTRLGRLGWSLMRRFTDREAISVSDCFIIIRSGLTRVLSSLTHSHSHAALDSFSQISISYAPVLSILLFSSFRRIITPKGHKIKQPEGECACFRTVVNGSESSLCCNEMMRCSWLFDLVAFLLLSFVIPVVFPSQNHLCQLLLHCAVCMVLYVQKSVEEWLLNETVSLSSPLSACLIDVMYARPSFVVLLAFCLRLPPTASFPPTRRFFLSCLAAAWTNAPACASSLCSVPDHLFSFAVSFFLLFCVAVSSP